jgi:hypothetical protein
LSKWINGEDVIPHAEQNLQRETTIGYDSHAFLSENNKMRYFCRELSKNHSSENLGIIGQVVSEQTFLFVICQSDTENCMWQPCILSGQYDRKWTLL